MNKSLLGLLLTIMVGLAAAWLNPAQPMQVAGNAADVAQPAFMTDVQGGASSSALLDNPNIASDPRIQPARKCGFCMG